MFNDRLNICRSFTIFIFVVILTANLVILSIGVHNDLPTITVGYSQMDEFPAPVISMQLKNNFTIACEFLLYDDYSKVILSYGICYLIYLFTHSFILGPTNCSDYLTQPVLNLTNSIWTGKFSPKDGLTFPRTMTPNRLKRIIFKFNVPNDIDIDGYPPAFTINIFDSTNKTLADSMYEESARDGYFEGTPFMTSVFRSNRYFLGRNYVSNNDDRLVMIVMKLYEVI